MQLSLKNITLKRRVPALSFIFSIYYNVLITTTRTLKVYCLPCKFVFSYFVKFSTMFAIWKITLTSPGSCPQLTCDHRGHTPGSDHKEEVSPQLPARPPAAHLWEVHGSHGAGEERPSKGRRSHRGQLQGSAHVQQSHRRVGEDDLEHCARGTSATWVSCHRMCVSVYVSMPESQCRYLSISALSVL